MNALTKAISVIALSMPLVACDTMGGFFGNSTPPPPPPPGAYHPYPENYHGRNYNKPVYGRTSEKANQPVVQQREPQQQSSQPQPKKPDVTMVEQGNSSAPTPATTPKINKGTEAPMVPGEAPSVE